MTIHIANRVHETTSTSGTGTLNLGGATDGHRIFVSGIGDGNECYYCCADDSDWEVGIGTVTNAAPDTLSRDTILSSSNGGSAVNWPGTGARDVFCVAPAEALQDLTDADLGSGIVVQDAARNFVRRTLTGGTGITVANGSGAAGNPDVSFTPGLPVPVASGGTALASYTKGDVMAASAGTTLTKLGVGSNDEVLTADSGESTGLKYAKPLLFSCTTKASGYTVTTSDGNTFFRLTAAATLTLPASPNANQMIGCTHDVSAGGTVTIAGNGKNIDGASTLLLAARYRSMLIIYDSTAGEWKKMVYFPSPSYDYSNIQYYNSSASGEWTVPSGYTRIKVHVIGAGGGGGSGGFSSTGTDSCTGGGGGGGGGYSAIEINTNESTVYDYIVGTGGAGGAAPASVGNGLSGTSGGASSWAPDGGAAVVTGAGGGNGFRGFGGSGAEGSGLGGSGGAGSGGDVTKTGKSGGSSAATGAGGAATGGGGGGAAAGEQNSMTDGADSTYSAGTWTAGAAGGTGSGGAAGGAGGATQGADGAAGTAAGLDDIESGGGGGGGAGTQSSTKGMGAGGARSGAGGGGGGGTNFTTPADNAGGAGYDGLVIVEW